MGAYKLSTESLNSDTFRVEFPEVMDKDFSQTLNTAIKEWLIQSSNFYIFDFKFVKDLKQSCYPSLLQFQKLLKQNNKILISHNLNSNLLHQVKTDGIFNVLNVVSNPEETINEIKDKNKPQLVKSKIDVTLINPFLAATKMTIEKQTKIICNPLKPYLADVNNKKYEQPIAIVGIMTISTEKFKGSISLAFPEKVFLKIYEEMLGETAESITNEKQDAAAELLNIIYGTAKAELNSKEGYKLIPVLPTVLAGEKLNIRQQTSQKIIILPFETPIGQFQIEISNDEV